MVAVGLDIYKTVPWKIWQKFYRGAWRSVVYVEKRKLENKKHKLGNPHTDQTNITILTNIDIQTNITNTYRIIAY